MAEEPNARHVDCPYHPDGERSLEIDLITGHYVCRRCGAEGQLTPREGSRLQMEQHWLGFI